MMAARIMDFDAADITNGSLPSSSDGPNDATAGRKGLKDHEEPPGTINSERDGKKVEQPLQRVRTLGRLRFRPADDDEPQWVYSPLVCQIYAELVHRDWWFASTAIPLIAATFAPMANVMSIAALVTSWRSDLQGQSGASAQANSIGIPDPRW